MIKNVYWSSCKAPFFSSDFIETLTFWTDFQKNHQISDFMIIHLVGAELSHADGQTDMKKLTVAFCNFANAPTSFLFLRCLAE